MSKKIKCPQCGKETIYGSENEFRPFCCKRCQLIDLGEWADEKHAIPGNEVVRPENVNDENNDDDRNLH